MKIAIIRRPEVLSTINVSNSTLDRRIKDGEFPPPISLGGRSKGWLESEVHELLKGLILGLDPTQIRTLVHQLVEDRQQISLSCQDNARDKKEVSDA